MTKIIAADFTPTSFLLPARDVQAVYCARSSEETRYYLTGVYIERVDHVNEPGSTVHIVATDGHILLDKIAPDSAWVGSECTTQDSDNIGGFILSVDVMEKAFKAKTVGDLWILGDIKTGILQFIDVDSPLSDGAQFNRVGVCEFGRIDGTFPDYRRVLPIQGDNSAPLTFDPVYYAQLAKANKLLGGTAITLNAQAVGDPISVGFPKVPLLTGVMMPMRA